MVASYLNSPPYPVHFWNEVHVRVIVQKKQGPSVMGDSAQVTANSWEIYIYYYGTSHY